MSRRSTRLLIVALLALTLLPAGPLPPALGPRPAIAAVDGSGFLPGVLPYERDNTRAVALGDVDGDGDLDLVVGNSDQPNKLYLNNGTTAPFANLAGGTPITADADNTAAVALGDVDGDGDLDLVTGNSNFPLSPSGQPNKLYLNNGTAAPFANLTSGTPITSDADVTSAVALGDVDGDGDLDLVAGNIDSQNKLYLNDGTTTPFANLTGGTPIATDDAITSAVALGDVDGDSDLDLVAGNIDSQNKLYLNNGTAAPFANLTSGTPITTDTDVTNALALGDVDGDGDLDLVAGNTDQPNKLYLNDGTAAPFANLTSGTPITTDTDVTNALALGDVDGDGDLDLVAGNEPQYNSDIQQNEEGQNKLYLNNGTTAPFANLTSGASITADADFTTAIALGDVDGDSDLDLVAGNYFAGNSTRPNKLYLNNGTAVPFANLTRGTPITTDADFTTAIALGDVDSDGDLDLVAANMPQYNSDTQQYEGGQNKLYLNDGTTAPFANLTGGSPITADVDDTQAVALGDVDGDGDLDLVAGNYGQNKLYLNNGTTAPFAKLTTGTSITADADDTQAVVLGDVDGDGHLDLVATNYGQPNKLYLNDGTTTPFASLNGGTPITGDTNTTTAVALGDVDGDGDLDLVTGNQPQFNFDTQQYEGGQNNLYLNDGTTAPFANLTSGIYITADTDFTQDLTLGDVDGDGDLDLVAGNTDGQNKLYLNDGTDAPFANLTSGTRIATDTDNIAAVALGDVDGDGDLDLVAANYGQPNKLYLNDGTIPPFANLTGSSLITADANFTRDVALGDVDGDGDLDLVTGNGQQNSNTGLPEGGQSTLYLRPGPGSPLPNNPPAVVAARPDRTLPGGTSSAGLYSAGRVISNTQVISIPFVLFDPEGDPARVRAEYSLDGGGRWFPALPSSGKMLLELLASPQGSPHLFPWDLVRSGVSGKSDNVVVRLLALPGIKPQRRGLPPPSQYPLTGSTTFPFRLRTNTARVLDAAGRPITNAAVYHLPAGAARGATQLTNWQTGAPLASNVLGYVASRNPIRPGDKLLALQPISHTDTYTLYLTSAPPGQLTEVGQRFGDQTLTVSPQRPLILFNLTVALEWDARSDAAFLGRLQEDIARASDLLYDWGNGQIALGNLQIYHNREHWDDAHIRIYATNRMRPNAVKGGITLRGAPLPDPDNPEMTYSAGQIRMGAVWNRYGEATANLGDDWARTLAHEIGHFALYLDDNYLGLDDAGLLIPVSQCRSAMADPYRDDWSEFQPAGTEWDTTCAQTLAERLTGRSDWETITSFYKGEVALNGAMVPVQLNAPGTFNASPGPAVQPLAFPQITVVAPTTEAAAPLAAPVFVLSDADGNQLNPLPGGSARGFLFQSRPSAEGGDQLVDLGLPRVDQLLARGARPGDRVCVFEPERERLGCDTVAAGYQPLALATRSGWRPDIAATPVNSTTLTLKVAGVAKGLTLRARLYPSSGSALAASRLAEAAGSYSVTLRSSPENPAFDGYIHVWVDEAAPRREAVVDFRVGGNPGRAWATNAPRGNPGRAWATNAPVLSSDGQAILFGGEDDLAEGQFYTIQTTSTPPAPPTWLTPVGPAYRISASAGLTLSETSLNIGYLGDSVPRGYESGIAMYRYDPSASRWEQLASELDMARNEAAAAVAEPGLYQLMAGASLPLTQQGWNLIFFYPGANQQLPGALESLRDGDQYAYKAIYGYDGTVQEPLDRWKLYGPALPAWVNDLDELRYGARYWIDATEVTTATLRPRTQSQLSEAGDLAAPPAIYYGMLPAGTPPGQKVVATIAGVACGKATTRLVNGRVVFVVDVVSQGNQTNCGLPGREVTITVGNRTFSRDWQSGPLNVTPETIITNPVYIPLLRR